MNTLKCLCQVSSRLTFRSVSEVLFIANSCNVWRPYPAFFFSLSLLLLLSDDHPDCALKTSARLFTYVSD